MKTEALRITPTFDAGTYSGAVAGVETGGAAVIGGLTTVFLLLGSRLLQAHKVSLSALFGCAVVLLIAAVAAVLFLQRHPPGYLSDLVEHAWNHGHYSRTPHE